MNFVTFIIKRSRSQINKIVSSFSPMPKTPPLIGDNMPEKSPLLLPMTLEERHQKAVELIAFLRKELESLETITHDKSNIEEHKKLLEENKQLKKEVELWRAKVIALEEQRGIKQYPISSTLLVNKKQRAVSPFDIVGSPSVKNASSQPKEETNSGEKTKQNVAVPRKKREKAKALEPVAKDDVKDIHVGRLDLRVGRIVSVDKHPDADTLYVEQIDIGEERPRTVVSGLVKHIPIDQMQNRLVIALCNLKPAKMRGILSEAMVMCASSPNKVEILNPPENSIPGDLVICDDFPGEPDALLNPKKKIFEQVAPDLKTNDECIATYKSSILRVGDKGIIKADTLVGVQIK